MLLGNSGWAGIAASLLLFSSQWTAAAPTRDDVDHKGNALGPRADDDWHWVATWTSMPQLVEQSNMPPSPFTGGGGVFKDATLRQTLHLSVGAERLRIQISNTFGGSDLPITAATIALPTGDKPGSASIDTSTLKPLTFNNGSASITIPRGQVAYTDPIDFSVAAQANIAVTLYSQPGQSGSSITGHPGSRTTSHMQAGNHASAATLSGGSSTKHWYFLSAVEAWSPPTTGALVVLGDSISDGRGSTDDANNRWPDLLLARLQKASSSSSSSGTNLSQIAVVNEAAGGNAVLSGGLGPTLLSRYKRDALQVAGVRWVLVFEGVNDIGGAATDAGTQAGVASRLEQAFAQIARDCKAAGLRTIGATITPFGGSGQAYSNPTRQQTREKVNDWILTSGTFDETVDFAAIVADKSVKSQLARQYDSGDHLHPNVAGYQAIADGFPLDVFQ
ncbi:00621136-af97-4f0b-b8c0-09cb37276600 [Thermothielavioides terrestris]|uniref:00621136-af97-4f0b-b8c0-09cb37276600 n=1 Tax=Thermothielavioides terrestris TaxID=2587410 RepID=A0A3S4EXB2_9PEZI|nr:00621136-af97-4f0b-b8c0-09cb37276600 [Thermothielavioides terrestris]